MGPMVLDEVQLRPQRLAGEGGGQMMSQAAALLALAQSLPQEAGIRSLAERVGDPAQAVGAGQGIDRDVIQIHQAQTGILQAPGDRRSGKAARWAAGAGDGRG